MTLKNIRFDFSAAWVGALATLPQAVAYGLIAIAPLGADWAVFGITASVGSSILFGLITGLRGPNRFMISGPGAVTALVMASALGAALARGYEPLQALGFAYASVVIAGLFQVVAGLLRLGHVTSYIPVPVLSGFANASALLVAISALPTVLGLPAMTLWEIIFTNLRAISFWPVAVGGLTIAAHLALDGRLKVVPGALVALATGTALYHLGTWGFALPNGPLIGHIDLLKLWREPQLWIQGVAWVDLASMGFTTPSLWRDADIPLLAGLSMGLLASFYTVICSSALVLRTDEPCDTNAELRVHGLANMLMGGLGFLPGSGSPSRSAAILDAGAKTRAANAGSAITFAMLLAVLAPVVAMLPLWATAGMLVATSVLAIDRDTLNKITNVVFNTLPYPRVVFGDIAVTAVVVVVALTFDLIAAVGLGVFLSVVLFVLGMGRNPVRRAYRGSRIHSKIQRPPEEIQRLEQEGHRIAVIEVQGALFFGSYARLVSQAQALLEDGVEYLILDFKHLSSIDSTGASKLRGLALMCTETGGKLMISYVEPERRTARAARALAKANATASLADQNCRRTQSRPRWIWLNLHANAITDLVGDDWFFSDTDSALARCERILLERLQVSQSPRWCGRIAHSTVMSGLSRKQIAQLGHYARRLRYRSGDTVFSQGDDANCAYFLVRGRMNVLIDVPGARRKKRVSTLTDGSIFGEMGLLDGAPRSASVTASRDSVCYAIDAELYADLQAQNPDLVATLLGNVSRQFSSRLRVANIMIAELDQ